MDNGDDFARMDFKINEVSSSAQWVKQAHQQNERKRAAERPESVIDRMRGDAAEHKPPPPPVLSASEQARLKGNDAFKQGAYQEVNPLSICNCYSRPMVSDGDAYMTPFISEAI